MLTMERGYRLMDRITCVIHLSIWTSAQTSIVYFPKLTLRETEIKLVDGQLLKILNPRLELLGGCLRPRHALTNARNQVAHTMSGSLFVWKSRRLT
jgi:hypothetical protein